MYVELAKTIKSQSQNTPTYEGFLIGEIVNEPPEIKISIDPAITLDKTNLIFASHVLTQYRREFEIEGEIQFTDENAGTTTTAAGHTHGIQSLNVNSNTLKAKGFVKWTDTLKQGDKVILIPAGNDQMYIVLDKAVTL